MGGEKGCNSFLGKKLANTCSFVGRHIIVQQEKISRTERSWTNPVNAHQEAIHYSLIKFCIYCFSLWYQFLMYYALRVEKNYQHGLDVGPLEFQFLQQRGCLTNPFRPLSLCFGVIGKTTGLICCNNFVKKLLSTSAIAMSWQDVTLSSLCSGIKECGTKSAHNFHFPKSSFRIQRTRVLGMFKDSAIILDAIQRSFLTKSATAMFTPVRVDFGWPLLFLSSTSSIPSQNREYQLKTFDQFTASFP
jgi:hypothetical protein